ncbi:unnamed protein product [Parnassius apollo]|uniref:E3 ubiquitin-protein ligase listerin n=1 Tax=Parnassius apollo TaxID=110799 RepID=A0A8S3Y435_PARAO|nr:unnamed protein product [Parnassius apollo]
MGGKVKQAHRTKNNARPSSSGRSAELLSSSVKDPAFFGLGTGKPLPPLFPTLAASNLEQGLNTEYALCFKKFNKKDPITRTKALQELLELIKNGNTDDVVAALPSWAHFYQIFTVDTDHKVRESAQACHASLVRVAGRRAAPQLRRLLPAWLLAQRDAHAPARYLAHASLTSTFPDGKLGEAFLFCKVEIISLLLENLMGNAEAMLSKKIENKEERDIQVSQIIASSLGALELFVVHLPPSHDDWLWDVLTPLLRAGSFWKMVQSTNEQHHIRAAWYGAVGRIMERFKDRFGAEYRAKAARALLGVGGGGGAGGGHGATQRWAALLLLVRRVPDWHTWFDKKDLLIKRILDVLENGGWGDARLLSDLLLPLLAHLPQEVLTKDFYTAFFNAMFLGLEKKNVSSSKSERQAWITNLADCVRYLSTQQYDFVLETITCVHRTWLEKVLSTQESQARNNLIKHSATNMTSLFKFWLKRSQEENSEKYDQLLRNCWQNIGSTISTQIDKLSSNDDEINRVMDSHILLLQNLKTAFAQESKKQHSIKFEGDADIKPEIIAVAKVDCDGPTTERYKHNLNEIVENTCAHYFEFAHKNKVCNTVLTSILTLLIEFDSKNLYLALARHFDADSIYVFYDGTLRMWLLDDTMRCKSLVDVVFLLVKYLNEEEQDCVFNSFEQLCEEAAEWCLALSVSHPHCGAGGVGGAGGGAARWACGAAAQRVLLRVCARALRSGDAHAHSLLLQCLAHPQRSESVISEDTVEKIVEQLCEAISDTSDSELERRARTAAQAAGAVVARRRTCLPLARALFALQLALPRGDERLSLDTWLEVRSSWQDAIFSLPDDAKQSLISDIISLVHQHLFNDMDKLDITKIENIVALLPYVITPSDYAEAPSDCSEIVSFTKQMFTFHNTDTSPSVEMYALKCDCIMGNLNCPFDDDNEIIKKIVEESSNKDVSELEKENLMYYTYKCLFKAFYLRTILLRKTTEDEEEECTQVAWCNTILRDVYFLEEFGKLLYHYMVLNTLNDRYGFWPNYEVIQHTKQRLDEIIKEIINETSNELRQKLRGFLSEKAAAIGYYWSYAGRFYEVKIDKNNKTEEETIDKSKTEDSLNASSVDETDEAEDNKSAEIPSVFDSEDQTPNTESQEESKETTLPVNETAEVENIEMEFDAEKLDEIVTGNGIFHSMQVNLKRSSSAEARQQCAYLVALRSWLAAHGVLDEEFLREAALCQRARNPDVFLNAYYRHKHTMLYERDITTAPWAQVVSNAAVLDFLTEIVADRGWDLPSHHWDFITITLCSLVNSLDCSVYNWGCTKMAMLCRSTLALLTRVQSFAVNVRRECERREPSDHVLALAGEWDEIFAPDINGNLFNIIITIMESNEKSLSSGHVAVLGALVSSIPHLQREQIPAIIRDEKFSLARISRAAADALQNSRHAPLKLLAFRVLRLLAEPLVLADAEMLAQWSAREVESARPELSLAYWDAALTHLQELVDAALSHLTVCEEVCELVAFSDSHSVALSYLLLSVAAYEHCQLARGDLVHHYIEHYRERKYGEYLVCGALRLLPGEVGAFARDDTAATPLPPRCLDHFVTTPHFTVEEVCSTRCVGVLACRALLGALGGTGVVAARGWYGAAPPRAARALRRLVAAAVAPRVYTRTHSAVSWPPPGVPPLVRANLTLLRKHAHRLPHAHVSIQWSSGEARCSLDVEERRVELSVHFSRAHPLEPPRLASSANSPAPDTQWLTVYLAYQNGTLLNAFKMWIRAVTARIQSAPQCYICYCRLHPADGRLPSVPCRQCRNKFHAPCLRKWFTTSNKSNCPLCRSSF